MKSFGILRTNVGLTTNVKIMVDSDHKLSLNSIDSSDKLSSERFKKFSFVKENYFDELIPYFFKDVPSDNAFEIKFSNDSETMSDDFSLQYDELYCYGARNISNNKTYKEEFEYFAPLYINRKSLPKKFIIFRVDGPGMNLLSKENFKLEILDKFKTVKVFDLTKESNLGSWLETNFKDNKYFPEAPLEMDFRNLEFCKWNGIDYSTGGYTTKSLFIDDILDEEKEIFELEKFIFSNYSKNKIVFPNILNFSFLFDDEPSTPDFKRKWSLNRYFGFYVDDMMLDKTISPWIPPFLRTDVQIFDGNIIYSESNPENPFVNEWSDSRPFYIEYNGNYYKVEKYTETGESVLTKNIAKPKPRITSSLPITNPTLSNIQNAINNSRNQNIERLERLNLYEEEYQTQTLTRYRIISDIELSGKESLLNKNFGYIDSENILKDYNNNDISIDNFDNYSVWLIEIDGIYHNLVKKTNQIFVNTDYSFTFNENDYLYKVAAETKKVSTIVDFENSPKKFNIYKINFTDIKDFDDRIIDTEFSKFEYEKQDEITYTEESKLYFEDLNSRSIPHTLDDFSYKNEVVNIPVSSEYTANYETFKIENNDLSEIWRLNPVYCRWSFQNSLHTADVPYMLNNTPLLEDFNKGPNLFDPSPNRIERNLDYFYTINSSTSSYVHHSLHIEKLKSNGDIDTTFRFELDKYLNSGTYSYDYFTYFFDRKCQFSRGVINKNMKKFSQFNIGDESIPNITLFKGIEFRLYDISSVTLNNSNEIENINLSTTNRFEDYKFSILLSDNDYSVNNSGKLVQSANSMSWRIIEEWRMDRDYETGDIVISDDILYISSSSTNTSLPASTQIEANNISLRRIRTTPFNDPSWGYYNPVGSIFWSPTQTYTNGDIVFNNQEWYFYYPSGTDDFWNPVTSTTTGYSADEIVLYKGQYYMSSTGSNNVSPDSLDTWVKIDSYTSGKKSYETRKSIKFWNQVDANNPLWLEIEMWNPSRGYRPNTKTVHENTIWKSNTTTIAGEEPGISKKWLRVYSIEPDTNLKYMPNSTGNPIIRMNNRYYLISSNTNSTLDNGLVIYINKKWKNVLVNINIADNTLPNITNADRDTIYQDLYKKLTATNFIQAINDITNRYDFTDYVSYVIIDESGKMSKYNFANNIAKLPYLLKCELPDSLRVKTNSLNKTPIQLPDKLRVFRALRDGKVNNLNELNYYNNLPVAATITENKFPPKLFEGIHGIKNKFADEIYRFTGYYMPLFYDIDLFEKENEMNQGNYKFDTTLTYFGMVRERKMRKCNLRGSILKLKDQNDLQSIYPMLDEFGYTISDFFIFKSTWDFQYHLQTIPNPMNINIIPKVILPNVETITEETFGKPDKLNKNLDQL